MMYKQLNITDLIAAIKARIDENTDLQCFDVPPTDEPAPLAYVELVGLQPADTKTMYCKIYTVWIHIIADEVKSSIPIYNYIQEVQEAMSEDISLPVNLVYQSDDGIQTIKTDETNEKHAVLEFSFKVNYGFKVKE